LREDLDTPSTNRGFSRRDFVRASVGSGFAAAVLPVTAQTVIKTDSVGLLTGEVMIGVGDFKLPAYRAAPLDRVNPPVVLVVSEVFGVHEYIADVARRLAKQGYFAVAPELFVRQGDPGAYGEIGKLLSEVIAKVPDAQVMADLDATMAWAAGQGTDTSKLGITGFCWGGRIAWLYAAHNPGVKAAVAWYGRLTDPRTALNPFNPVDLAAKLQAPVLGLYGGQDSGIPLEAVDRMKAALALGSDAAKRSSLVVYPEAPHAFHADYRNSYRQDAAGDAWQRCLAWLKIQGVV
jgi:carboxymethylenebutenolidase